MPGTRCTVAVCNNSFEKTKRAGMKIMYHQFPKSQPLRNIWIERCRRAGNWNPSSCHVCSIHFTEDDYRRDLSAELLNIPGKRRLKSTAIPSLFLTEPPPIGLTSIVPRKKKKLSIGDDPPIYLQNNENIYLQLDNSNIQSESIDGLPIYDICETENTDEEVIYMPEYDNDHIDTIDREELNSYYQETKKNKQLKEINDKYSSSKFQIASIDCSTQTDTDHFIENYKQLLDKNEDLEREIVRWSKRYKQLMSNMKFLESKIQRLTLNSKEIQS